MGEVQSQTICPELIYRKLMELTNDKSFVENVYNIANNLLYTTKIMQNNNDKFELFASLMLLIASLRTVGKHTINTSISEYIKVFPNEKAYELSQELSALSKKVYDKLVQQLYYVNDTGADLRDKLMVEFETIMDELGEGIDNIICKIKAALYIN